jgi:hypothetical protein
MLFIQYSNLFFARYIDFYMGEKNDPLIQMEKSECVHPLQIFL